MSESLALHGASAQTQPATQPARKRSFGAMIGALLESLVAAHARSFPSNDPLAYRFPPL